jgi:hypothetical protein
LSAEIEKSGGQVIILPLKASLLERAFWLRQALQSSIDLVMLHPGIDIVPLVAMATADCPPVAIVNHADHLFWIGCSIAECHHRSSEHRMYPDGTEKVDTIGLHASHSTD